MMYTTYYIQVIQPSITVFEIQIKRKSIHGNHHWCMVDYGSLAS